MGRVWQDDLNEYLLMYRSSPHSITQKTPAQMLFGRNIRDKLPSINQPMEIDEATADKDKEKKEKGKQYDMKISDIEIGDEVLVKRMNKTNKLSSNYGPDPFMVVEKKGGDVVIEDEVSGKRYRRHISHLQKIDRPLSTMGSSGTLVEDPDSAQIKDRRRSQRSRKRPERF